jgi:hypothetical protein
MPQGEGMLAHITNNQTYIPLTDFQQTDFAGRGC